MSVVLDTMVRELARGPLEPATIASAEPGDQAALLEVLAATARTVLASDGDGAAAHELLAMAAIHPSAHVRRTLVGTVAASGAATEAQRELLCWAVSDPDDEVAIAATRACLRHGLTDALLPLMDALGRAPDRLEGNLAGLTDRRTYVAVRAARELRPAEVAAPDVARAATESGHSLEAPAPDVSDMVLVPAGAAQLGLRSPALAPGWFPADSHLLVRRRVEVAAFHIDRHPVTNAQYDAYVAASSEFDHAHCHPDEPPGTDHTRATILDPWAAPDHPVTGVSWFDAYSYAAFHGKRLPTDVEWEYAAGGPDGLAHPWGDDFDPAACRWLGTVTGRSIASLEDWEAALEEVLEAAGAARTAAPGDQPANVSPFGVHDLAGNAWEWTASRYLDGGEIQPRGWSPADPRRNGDWTALACVKGGGWASGGDMLLNAYRGRQALHRRSAEIGFRCAASAEDRA